MRREEIITVARALFSRYGLEKTTTKDISSALKLQKGALYYYFKNKEEIFSEVIRREMYQLQNKIGNAVREVTGVVNKMNTYIRIRMVYLKLKADEFTTIRDEYLKNYSFIEQLREDFSNWEADLVKKILRDGNKSGELHLKDVNLVAETITLAIKGLEYVWVTKMPAKQIELNVGRLTSILFNGLLHSD